MTCVLDAFALVGLALEEPAADEVETLIRRGDSAVTAINLAEALDQLARVHRRDLEELRWRFGPVIGELVALIAVDESLSWRAVGLRGRHYHRRQSPVSLADCVALAAVGPDDSIATADQPLARAARSEGLDVITLAEPLR
jgi:PIN domain nuclease of toxin-antitoxin system